MTTTSKVLVIEDDIDQKITEEGGTEAANQALIFTARVMRASFRDCDVVARLRGGEFAMLMAESTEKMMMAADEALSEARTPAWVQ